MHLNYELFADQTSTASSSALEAVEVLANQGSIEDRGAFFTRREVVEFILDLVGYDALQPLHKQRILEPSFGGGDFLFAIVDRLLNAWRLHSDGTSAENLSNAIRAVELHRATFLATRQQLTEHLEQAGLTAHAASFLTDCWLIQDDFLLTQLPAEFDYVVGNPPYVRQELIPDSLMREYRARYKTIYDRADLYIPFIERSLKALASKGTLGFICADRWMKNRYGGPLRSLIASDFHLKAYIDMVGSDAFHSTVVAYPAITIVSREASGPTRIAHRPATNTTTLTLLAESIRAPALPAASGVRELSGITSGDAPWLLESAEQLELLQRLELEFPLLEATGCKVGIGVATGADKIYIREFASLDVEPDCKLPLATTRDIISGEVEWQGQGVINPFTEDGDLVDLGTHPRLRKYLEQHREQIANRHCAQKNPNGWFRTIDRIDPSLGRKPKLLIPDIKGEAHVVFEPGELYPHHNLYYVTSESWELRALQAVLLSAISRLFVASYSTKMRGGFLRFQAQYLRRIRLPHWQAVSDELRQALRDAAIKRDIEACNQASFRLYGLNKDEIATLGGNGV